MAAMSDYAGWDILPDHEAEGVRDDYDILESESPMAVHVLDTPADALRIEFESEFAHWPVQDRNGSTTTANRVLELIQMASGGCCIVVAPRSRLQRLALRSTDQGYMSRRMKGVHVTQVAFAASLIEFSSHTETDRWPSHYHDTEAAGQPKDGAIFIAPSGYCAKAAAMMLGLVPPTQWPGRGTRHLSALAAAAHLGNSIVFIRSDSGSVHILLGKDQGIIVRRLKVDKGIERLSPGASLESRIHELWSLGEPEHSLDYVTVRDSLEAAIVALDSRHDFGDFATKVAGIVINPTVYNHFRRYMTDRLPDLLVDMEAQAPDQAQLVLEACGFAAERLQPRFEPKPSSAASFDERVPGRGGYQQIVQPAPAAIPRSPFITLLNLPGINELPLHFLRVDDLAQLERCCRRFSLHRQERLIAERQLLVQRGTKFQDLVDFRGFSQNRNVVSRQGILYEVIQRHHPNFDYICLDEARRNIRSRECYESQKTIMIFHRKGFVSGIEESTMRMKTQRNGPHCVDINRITFTFRCSALTGRQP